MGSTRSIEEHGSRLTAARECCTFSSGGALHVNAAAGSSAVLNREVFGLPVHVDDWAPDYGSALYVEESG